MDRPWLTQYPAGVPADIDIDRFPSLKDVLGASCSRFASLPAFSSMGAALTFRQLDEVSRAFAAWLQASAGLKRGDRVALMMPNLLQYPVALFGVLRAGMVVVNVNPLYTTPRELEHQLKDSGAVAIVVLENFAHMPVRVVESTPLRVVVTTQVGDLLPPLKRLLTNAVVKYVKQMAPPWKLAGAVTLRQALAAGRRQPLGEVTLAHDDLAFLQYTGGTNGVAKGAMLTHGNMVANVLQVAAWMSPGMNDGAETVIIPLPQYQVFALTGCLSFFSKGRANRADRQPARPADVQQGPRADALLGDHRRQYALSRAARRAGLDPRRLERPQAGGRRRHGRAAGGRASLEADDRSAAGGGL
jgi:long-chain acyl-CoA synthetase